MEYLHAYWRIPYIDISKEEKMSSDPFLDILENPDERKSLLLFRSVYSFVVLNKYPYNAGHLLVLPKKAVKDLDELEPQELEDFWATVLRSKKILQEALHPNGINIGINLGSAAGAGIPQHLHCHLVPRWEGDCNFMPIIGDTRVLPIALESMWETLRKFVD